MGESIIREQLVEKLRGGFAPSVILLREFDHQKAGVILDGLHFSAWILLGHIKDRQQTLLQFIKDPVKNTEVWNEAKWPDNHEPSREEWEKAIEEFEKDLEEVISLVQVSETDLLREYTNEKTVLGAALTIINHNSYHIGQLKTIGRQLGVW